jgi:hypothetical protein
MTSHTKYPYPFVECDEHEGKQMSYIICIHVFAEGKPAAHVVKCNKKDPGEILCLKCTKESEEEKEKHLEEFGLICAVHAEPYLAMRIQ